jgi:hypothetical protein
MTGYPVMIVVVVVTGETATEQAAIIVGMNA